MYIAVFGGNGQLGADVCSVLEPEHQVSVLTHADVDIADTMQLHSVLDRLKPQCVVNTAAMHHVERCEADPATAYAVNGIGVRGLAQWCAGQGAHLVHISTDYVFDGKKHNPYVENDAPLPVNVYGNTKLAGEHYALSCCPTSSVVRVGGIYGVHPCRAKGGLNFVQLMLKLAKEKPELRVVDDEIVTPTPTAAIARQLRVLIEKKAYGLFHATCQGQCSWYAFAKRIFELSGVTANLLKARPGEFPAKVQRPAYSVLENAHLKSLNLDVMPSWEDGLATYLESLREK